MERKIRIGAVSYLNTLPLVYGFNSPEINDKIELIFDFPANVASMLATDEIDIGLIPVAAILQLNEAHIIGDYCIGAVGEVASVCVFSDVPISEIEVIYSDYQSRTSAALLKILLKEYWQVNPEVKQAFPGYEDLIQGKTAGLIIGDRALENLTRYKYVYDFADAWIKLTGLPFVFAAWVANKKLDEDFVKEFNNATGNGLQHIDEIVSNTPYPHYDLKKYYLQNVDYVLEEKKRKALKLFLEKIATASKS